MDQAKWSSKKRKQNFSGREYPFRPKKETK